MDELLDLIDNFLSPLLIYYRNPSNRSEKESFAYKPDHIRKYISNSSKNAILLPVERVNMEIKKVNDDFRNFIALNSVKIKDKFDISGVIQPLLDLRKKIEIFINEGNLTSSDIECYRNDVIRTINYYKSILKKIRKEQGVGNGGEYDIISDLKLIYNKELTQIEDLGKLREEAGNIVTQLKDYYVQNYGDKLKECKKCKESDKNQECEKCKKQMEKYSSYVKYFTDKIELVKTVEIIKYQSPFHKNLYDRLQVMNETTEAISEFIKAVREAQRITGGYEPMFQGPALLIFGLLILLIIAIVVWPGIAKNLANSPRYRDKGLLRLIL